MENKDIKDFQSVSTVSELDNILLVQSSGIGGKMTVALFKTAVRNDVTPSIKDNVWWIGTVNTGVVAAGKTPEFRKGDLGIEWKYTTETAWKLLVNYESISLTFDDLTEAQKDSLKLHFSDLTEADIAELQQPAQDMIAELENTNTSVIEAEALRVEAEEKRQTDTAAAVKSATDAADKANTAAENVEDGKTPVLEMGTVSQGSSASATVTADGTDASGNPKYKINLTLPKGDAGDDGKTPVLEIGSTVTGNPGTQASASLTADGTTTEGHPKYLLSLTIPRGDKGLPGEGSGNVSASGTGLQTNKKYLFVPASNGSTEGSFVEYTAPTIPEQVQPDWNAASGKGSILNKPTIPTKVSQLTNDSNYASKTYVDEEISQKLGKTEAQGLYVALQGYVAYSQAEKNKLAGIQANANNFPDAPSDNKQYGRKNGAWSEVDAGTGNVKFYDLQWIANAAESGSCTQAQYDSLIEAINNNCYFGVPVNMHVQSNGDVIVSMFAGYGETSMMVIQEYVVSSSLTVSTSDGAIYSSYRQIDNVVGDSNGNASLALRMNMLHVVTNCTRLSVYIYLAEGNEGIFQFTCGSTPVTLVMPSTVKWINEPTIEANKTYQVSVLNNIAVIGGVQ